MLHFDYVSPGTLIPYAKNARQHPPAQVAMIAASIKEFGFTVPILVREDMTLIAGHGRLEAALKLGLDKVPIVRASHLTEAQARALVHVDNQIALKSTWDFDLLKLELEDIKFDFDPYDFDLPDFEVVKEGKTDDDAVPDVEKNVHGVVLGDVWKLGDHTVMCGDSKNVQDVENLMDGQKADMVFTDPPYGMNLDTDYSKLPHPKAKAKKYKAKKYSPIIGDDEDFDPRFLLEYFKDVSEIILFGADYYARHLPAGSWFVWDKRVTENFDAMIGSAFELCWSKKKHKREIARFNNTLFSGEIDAKNKVHPTQKPVKLIDWFFERLKGPIVIDLFLGSGTTLIACEKTDRKCYGMELDPHYCSIIIERWQQFTGKKAERI